MALESLPPSILALLASVGFGISNALAKKVLDHTDPNSGAVLTMGLTMLCFWALAPFERAVAQTDVVALVVFGLMGLARPVYSLHMMYAGVRILGPTISSTVSATTPLFGTLIAVALLGEVLTLPVAVATLGIVGGIACFAVPRRGPRNWSRWALLIPFSVAMARGIAQVLARYGLSLMPAPILAGVMAYTVGFFGTMGLRTLRRAAVRPRISRAALFWCAMAAGVSSAAYILLLLALEDGTVVIVGPILATNPVFTLMISAWVFQDRTITRRTLAGVALIVSSVVLLNVAR